jgi:hypothetical protein
MMRDWPIGHVIVWRDGVAATMHVRELATCYDSKVLFL